MSNPSFQIHLYLQQTPPDWGILTNGNKWRLYHAPSSYKFDSYYEIDLPTVLGEGDLEGWQGRLREGTETRAIDAFVDYLRR